MNHFKNVNRRRWPLFQGTLPLDRAQIRDYLEKIHPLDKAGAYAIQEFGELIISEISGSYSNVVGLPVELLREELQAWGEPRFFKKSPALSPTEFF